MTITVVESSPEQGPELESPPATADTPASPASPTGTAEPTSPPTPPVYLTLNCQLPGGYRLVSLHLMYDSTWNVTIGSLPTLPDSTGASLGYSEYYGTGRHEDPNTACEQAIAMVDFRRVNQVPLKKQVASSTPRSASTSGLKIPLLNLDDLDIKL